jgi:DNA-binding CsgD family transcriptional regulator
MHPRFGFTDELRVVFLSRGTSWGALGLYRAGDDRPFTATEVEQLAGTVGTVAAAIQRSLFGAGPFTAPAADDGPAVLVVDGEQRVSHLTPAAREVIEDLGGWDHGELPASVLAVVAGARSSGAPLTTRALSDSGRWTSLRAAPLDGGAGRVPDVVVSLEATSRAVLSRMALAAHGLTTREEEVALLVLQGASTAGIAGSLHLSPHTVQDHLKSIFDKVGVRSRRELTAKLVLT